MSVSRTNGFIALLLLSLAILFMKTRLPARRSSPNAAKVSILLLLKDVPYLFAVAGYAVHHFTVIRPDSGYHTALSLDSGVFYFLVRGFRLN